MVSISIALLIRHQPTATSFLCISPLIGDNSDAGGTEECKIIFSTGEFKMFHPG